MKKALLVISFGTSYAETREKNIESCEKQLAAAFPGRDFFRAFTSGMIIRKLKERDNLHINNPEEALRHLHEQGYEDVAIQSLHVINGKRLSARLKNTVRSSAICAWASRC